jgi:hypothetical protein
MRGKKDIDIIQLPMCHGYNSIAFHLTIIIKKGILALLSCITIDIVSKLSKLLSNIA